MQETKRSFLAMSIPALGGWFSRAPTRASLSFTQMVARAATLSHAGLDCDKPATPAQAPPDLALPASAQRRVRTRAPCASLRDPAEPCGLGATIAGSAIGNPGPKAEEAEGRRRETAARGIGAECDGECFPGLVPYLQRCFRSVAAGEHRGSHHRARILRSLVLRAAR